jgi:hypothetical protein
VLDEQWRQVRTSRLQQPQRAAVEHGGLGVLAVAEALVAGSAEPLHRVGKFRGHSRARQSNGGRLSFPLSDAEQRPRRRASRRKHQLSVLGSSSYYVTRGRDGGGAFANPKPREPGPSRELSLESRFPLAC